MLHFVNNTFCTFRNLSSIGLLTVVLNICTDDMIILTNHCSSSRVQQAV